MSLAVDFHRRVLGRTRSYPCQLLWLICRPPGERCLERQRVAKEILSNTAFAENGRQELNALRFAQLFEAALKEAKHFKQECFRDVQFVLKRMQRDVRRWTKKYRQARVPEADS